jgi:AcrR family transcriptional regulator
MEIFMPNPHALLLDKMSDYVLAQGLRQATLRPLARAANTSDRMLIYHFGSKDGVIAALLDHLTQRLTALMDAAVLPAPVSTADLMEDLLTQMQSPPAHPYTCLWLEVVTGAAREEVAYRQAAERILTHFESWVAARLPRHGHSPEGRAAEVAMALAMIEGCLMIGATGPKGALLKEAALAQFRAAMNTDRKTLT